MKNHDGTPTEPSLPFVAGAVAVAITLFSMYTLLLDAHGVGGYLRVSACTWGSLMALALLIRWRLRAAPNRSMQRTPLRAVFDRHRVGRTGSLKSSFWQRDGIERNGEEPPLVGLACEDLVAVEYSHAGQVVEPAHVVFLRFAGSWHRLNFDCGSVFWRADTDGPQSFVAEELDASYRAVSLVDARGLRGLRLHFIRYSSILGGSEVALVFEGGRTVVFRCVDGVTSYDA